MVYVCYKVYHTSGASEVITLRYDGSNWLHTNTINGVDGSFARPRTDSNGYPDYILCTKSYRTLLRSDYDVTSNTWSQSAINSISGYDAVYDSAVDMFQAGNYSYSNKNNFDILTFSYAKPLTINGDLTDYIAKDSVYEDPGAVVRVGYTLTTSTNISNTVVGGENTITYTATNGSNTYRCYRRIIVQSI